MFVALFAVHLSMVDVGRDVVAMLLYGFFWSGTGIEFPGLTLLAVFAAFFLYQV